MPKKDSDYRPEVVHVIEGVNTGERRLYAAITTTSLGFGYVDDVETDPTVSEWVHPPLEVNLNDGNGEIAGAAAVAFIAGGGYRPAGTEPGDLTYETGHGLLVEVRTVG